MRAKMLRLHFHLHKSKIQLMMFEITTISFQCGEIFNTLHDDKLHSSLPVHCEILSNIRAKYE